MARWQLRVKPVSINFREKRITFEYDEESVKVARNLHSTYQAEGVKTKRRFSLEIDWWIDPANTGQKKLLRAVEGVISFAHAGDYSLADGVHEGLLELYGTDQTIADPLAGTTRTRKKRSNEMNKLEMSRVVEGAFKEVTRCPGDIWLSDGSKIRSFWKEWRNWRGSFRKDPLENDYASVDEYKDRIPFCEASLVPLGPYEGNICHIVSRGAGGPTEPWNLLHLSQKEHTIAPESQHVEGWDVWLKRNPHLAHKVRAAFKRMGKVRAGKRAKEKGSEE